MHGQDLTALKNAMDDGGDAHNIHKLIYNDILVGSPNATYLLCHYPVSEDLWKGLVVCLSAELPSAYPYIKSKILSNSY